MVVYDSGCKVNKLFSHLQKNAHTFGRDNDSDKVTLRSIDMYGMVERVY